MVNVRVVFAPKKNIFTARVTADGKTLSTKSFSISANRDEDQAYDEVVAAAKSLAKKHKVKAIIPSKEELLSRRQNIDVGRQTSDVVVNRSTIGQNPLVEKFGHAGRFKAMIRQAIKAHGADKVKEVLFAAGEEVEEALKADAHERKVISDANREIAQVILNARKSGVNMPAPSPEVEEWIRVLEANEQKRNSQKSDRQRYVGIFEMDGERWDGTGHIPASFSKFLQENEDKTIEDLRIS